MVRRLVCAEQLFGKAKGQKFRIGSSKQEQEAVAAKFFDGKPPGKLAMEDEQTVTRFAQGFLAQYEVTRGQFRRFVEETGYQTIPEQTDAGKGWNANEQKFVGADKRFCWRDTGLDFQTDDHPVGPQICPGNAMRCRRSNKERGGRCGAEHGIWRASIVAVRTATSLA